MKQTDDKKILLMDYKASRRDSLASRFRLQGFAIELSNSGFQSLSMIEKEVYDVFLVVENCADMSAFEAISLARSIYTKEELQILYISKSSNQENIIKYLDIGVNDYIIYSDTIFSSLLEKIQSFKPKKLSKPKKGMLSEQLTEAENMSEEDAKKEFTED